MGGHIVRGSSSSLHQHLVEWSIFHWQCITDIGMRPLFEQHFNNDHSHMRNGLMSSQKDEKATSRRQQTLDGDSCPTIDLD